MAYTASIVERLLVGGDVIEFTNTLSGDNRNLYQWSVADSVTDQLVTIAIDVDKVTLFYLVSTYALTFETNSAASPADTITLVAGIPYVWYTSKYDTFLLGTDVTAVYLSNASGSTAEVDCLILQDSTP